MTEACLLTPALATRLADIALGHVRREYPHGSAHVLASDRDALTPAALHPIFFGSFDWHSCVHAHWTLARLLRLYPDLPSRTAIIELLDAQFLPGKVEAERVYFSRPESRGFERPYGWAWLLALAAELSWHRGGPWATTLSPLSEAIVDRFRAYLPLATYPVRTGTHGNTAFALRLAFDYADWTRDRDFAGLLRETAMRWYGDDVACPAWGEPGGDDFLSPVLIEAACMRRLMPRETFRTWFDRFLPNLADGEPKTLFAPPRVSDRTDGKIAHLDGLALSRAWCWGEIACALDPDDPRRPIMRDAASRHLAAGLPHVAETYMGEHWLATYALLALTTET